MKNEALNAFYKNLLEDVGLRDNHDDGLLSWYRAESDDFLNVSLGGKRLALPTRENLKVGSDKLCLFHPASEQLMSGPSPVLDALREYIMMRLSGTAQGIAGAAMAVAADVKLQKKVRGVGNELLKPLTAADEKMIDTLDKVFENVGATPDNRIYNLFLVASGSKENPRGLRTTKVSYPILDDAFNDDATEFFGVKMPRKTRDKPGIVGLLSIILNNKDDNPNQIDEYTSELRQAPYFHSLLTAFYDIASHQNKLIASLKGAIPHLSELEYKFGWKEEFDDFENFIKLVGHSAPLLPGNSGKPMSDSDKSSEGEDNKSTTKGTSWKDLRDSLPEEEPQYEDRTSRRETKSAQSGWRALLKASHEEDDRGISFGRNRGRSRRGGFDRLGEEPEDRYSRRDRDYGRRPTYESSGWREKFR